MTLRLKLRYWFAIGCVMLAGIVAAGAAVLLETEAGLHWTIARVESFSNGAVKIGTSSGHLAGPFTLDDLRVTLPDAVIEARHLEIDWNPLALISGELHVTSLLGSDVLVTTRPSKTPSQGLPRQLKLPLHIVIDGARFKQFTLHMPGNSLHLDHLAFALDAGDHALKLDKLEARGPRIALGGELHTQPYGDWTVQARLALLLRLPGYPAMGGHMRLDGTLRGTLRLDQTLDTPFQAELKANVAHLSGTPSAHGTLRIARLDPNAINPDWPQLPGSASLAFDGSLKDFTTHGTLTLISPQARTVTLDLDAGLDNQRIRIEHLTLALAGTPTRLALFGTLQTIAPHDADLTLAWRHLRWPLQSATPIASAATGGAHLTGNPQQWALTMRTLLQARGLPQGRWALAAQGDAKTITLDALAGRWLDGTIAGHGQLRLEAGHPFQLSARVRHLQTKVIAPKVQGQIGFNIAANGKLAPMQANARILKLAGRLQGHPVTGAAEVAYANDTLTVNRLALAAGPNHLSAKGRWGTKADLSWQLQAPQLAALGNGLAGRLEAKGSIRGRSDAPSIRATLDGTRLHWNDFKIAEARAAADIDLNAHTASSLELHVKNLERGNLELHQFDARLEGPPQAQHFAVSVKSNDGNIELAGNGHLDHGRWTGTLTTGKLVPEQGPDFDLCAPVDLMIGADKLALEKSCWHGPNQAQFHLAATSGVQGWTAELALQAMPLDLADPYLSGGMILKGKLNGFLRAKGGNGTLLALGELHAGHGQVSRKESELTQRLAFDEAGLLVHLDETNVTARLGIILDDGGILDATAAIPWRTRTRPVGNLHLRARLPDLSGLGALSTAVTGVGGRLDADFDMSGSLEAPHFKGDMRLSHATLTLTRFGTRIKNGHLLLHGAGSGFDIDGTLDDAAQGRLAVRGTLRRRDSRWTLNAHVGGKDFLAVDIPEAKVTLSPNLDIGVEGYAIKLDGSIDIPSAQIRPPHFSNAISPTPDLVIVGEKKTQAGPPWRLTTQLHIRLGDKVHFVGYGLSARVGGDLTIDDTPGKLTTASGELKILDGQYKAYGQDLSIQRGRLLFSGGPISNPGLDMRAVRTVGLVTAGLRVTGTLRNPQLQVFSDPPMSQSNALAYMLFGHGMQQTSNSQQSIVNSAANAIGIAGGTYLVKSLGQHVGIDTVSVENANEYNTNANQASLFLGKYLSPRLYVSYGIGLYAPINLLRIRYTLSRHWALEAESGTFSGADILFNIEH